MKTQFYLIIIAVILSSCEKSIYETANDYEILIDESFEYENIDEFFENTDWSGSGSIFPDAPKNSGDKSIQLSTGWCPTRDLIETNITGLSNIQVLKLTLNYKFKDLNGTAKINLRNLNTYFGISHGISASDTLWHEIILCDTLRFFINDSLSISLAASCNELLSWRVLFDSVKLENLELKLIL